MKLNRIIILALLAITITACTKDIDYKGPDGKRMLVVNSITGAGDTLVLKMSHSAYFLDTYRSSSMLENDVNVKIDINGDTRIGLYSDSLKGFSDGRIINQGDIISVSASHQLYGSLSATDTVPYAQEMSIRSYTKEYIPARTMSEMFDKFKPQFDTSSIDSIWVNEIDIHGRKDTTDFYILSVHPTMTYYKYDYDTFKYDTITKDISFRIPPATKVLMEQENAQTAVVEESQADNLYLTGHKYFIFDDQYIKDGEKLSFEIVMQKPDTLQFLLTFDPVSKKFIPGDRAESIAHLIKDNVTYNMDIRLHVLSSTCYYYYMSSSDFKQSNITLMSEPVTVLHNVKGGLGILGAYATTQSSPTLSYKFK